MPVSEVVRFATDGSILVNPGGAGGWAVVWENGETLSGGEPESTNNRMELTAVIEGLNATREGSTVVVHCDSQYVVKGITEYYATWVRKGWKKIKNRDLWEALYAATQRHAEVRMVWIKGHAGHPANEKADVIAYEAAKQAELLA